MLEPWQRTEPDKVIDCPKCGRVFDRAGPKTVVLVRSCPAMREQILPGSTTPRCPHCKTLLEKHSQAA